jgi:hypothetical protein
MVVATQWTLHENASYHPGSCVIDFHFMRATPNFADFGPKPAFMSCLMGGIMDNRNLLFMGT